jgi:sec-independent protein translocase protein TatC
MSVAWTMDERRITFVEHLEELRRRLLWALGVWALCAGVAFTFVETWIPLLVRPVGRLVFVAPAEAFTARLVLALGAGVVAAVPCWIWQLWAFVAPALEASQRRFIGRRLPLAVVLFYTGAGFALIVALPAALRFLLGFATEQIQPMITVGSYVSFVTIWTLLFGVIFELPVAFLVLGECGLVSAAMLAHYRRHAVLAIFIVAAIFTPPDVVSQFMMAVPLLILFEMSVWLLRWSRR